MKYKACCGGRCMLSHCKTRESGGCYCVCRLNDAKHSLESLLDGRTYKIGDGLIYNLDRPGKPLEGQQKEDALKQLDEVNERLKQYELETPE